MTGRSGRSHSWTSERYAMQNQLGGWSRGCIRHSKDSGESTMMNHERGAALFSAACKQAVLAPGSLLLVVAAVLPFACQEHVQHRPAQAATREMEFSMTRELVEACVEARTRAEFLRARERLVDNLKSRYKGIDASIGGSAATEHSARFSRLMREWNPIGFSTKNLRAIAGEPSRATDTELDYEFVLAEYSCCWRFMIIGDTINGVVYIPGE